MLHSGIAGQTLQTPSIHATLVFGHCVASSIEFERAAQYQQVLQEGRRWCWLWMTYIPASPCWNHHHHHHALLWWCFLTRAVTCCPVPRCSYPRLLIENRVYCSRVFRKLHIELAYRQDGLQVLHCVMYPRYAYDLPILAMDLVVSAG